jgi:Domain of unknown function (DUF4349)
MRVINFPGTRSGDADATWATELDAALNGDGQGAAAESWRELSADVRALAPPLDPALEQRLRAEIDRRTARRRRRRRPALSGVRSLSRPAVAALASLGIAACAAVIVLTLVLPGIDGSSSQVTEAVFNAHSRIVSPAESRATNRGPSGTASSSAQATEVTPFAAEIPATPGRVQQQGATLKLSAEPTQVQSVSDEIAQLAARDGGFVQSSHVQVETHGQSEAVLDLNLPSTRLSAALAALGRLAPVRSETQALQDITNTYDTARKRLNDAQAERAALLRALAKATTAGEIASLRERLSQSRSAIAAAQAHVHAISQRASNSEVEVTVAGTASNDAGGLTVHRGLHDAGRVLMVAFAGTLIVAAALLPLALLVILLLSAVRLWRRYARERALADS